MKGFLYFIAEELPKGDIHNIIIYESVTKESFMNIIKPKKLQKGDTIGFLSASGNIREYSRIKKAKQYFEDAGYKVIVSENSRNSLRYMAGSDEERINALHNFFADSEIKAIVCTRGGYGAIRIMNFLDYELIKDNPKIFIGYSDYSALLAMIYKKTGLITFHGPMANGDFGCDNVNTAVEKSFFDIITSDKDEFIINSKPFYKTYYKGIARGILWGGNLTTLASLAGQDFIPDENIILFLEDINEPAYKIDRALTQLLNIKKFKNRIAGIILGSFTSADNKSWVEDIFKETAQNLKVPVVNNFDISHEETKITVPFGVKCMLDADLGMVKIIENCVV